MRSLRAVVLALPGLLLGVVGLFHPMHLTYGTSYRWYVLHLVGLFLFPLVGVALVALLRGRRDPVAWLVVLASYVYATAYSGLDIISGIAAGYVVHSTGPGQPRPGTVADLLQVGGGLGEVDALALVLAAAVVAVDGLVRLRLRGLPGVLLLPGAYLVQVHHIYAPEGVAGVVLLGVATGWLAYADPIGRIRATAARRDAVSSR